MSLKNISIKKQESVAESKVKSPPENPIEAQAVQPQPQNESIAEVVEDETFEEAAPVIFQAIGLIEADSVKLVENKIIITITNQEYQGFVRPRSYKQLGEFLEKHDGTTYLRVYPKTLTANKKLIFQGWQILDWKKGISPQNKAGKFVIKGIWQ